MGPYADVVLRRVMSSRWLVLALVSFAILRAYMWLLSLPVSADGDAPSYLPGPSLEVESGFYIGLEKVSISGLGVMRPWPATLLFGLIPEMNMRSAAQLLISIGAFVFLAWAIHCTLRSTMARVAGVASVLIVGLTPVAAVWDSHLWRESLSISSLVFLLAFTLLFAQRPQTWLAAAIAVSGMVLILMRFTYFPVALAIFILVVVLSRSGPARRSLVWSLGFSLAFLGVLGYGYTYFKAQDSGWIPWYGQSISESQFGYIHSASNPAINVLMESLAQEYPKCVAASIPVEAEYPSKHWYHVLDNAEDCPELVTYIRSGEWSNDYVTFVALNPEYSARVLWRVLPVAMGSQQTFVELSPLPLALASFVVPISTPAGHFDPLALWLLAAFALAIAARRIGESKKLDSASPESPRRGALIVPLVLLVSAAAAVAIGTLLTPTADADPFRISIAASIGMRIAAILLAAAALDALLLRSRSDVHESS